MFAVCILIFTNAYGQQGTGSSGADASGGGGSVSYTLGQVVYNSYSGSTGSIEEGVQHAYTITVTTGLENPKIQLSISVYPNPTSRYLTLQVENSTGILYEIWNIAGQLLESKKISSTATTITMDQYPTGTYLFKVIQENNEIKTFHIIKN